MNEIRVPHWACSQWGNYEHDWLDCPECLDKYQIYLEEDLQMGGERETHLNSKISKSANLDDSDVIKISNGKNILIRTHESNGQVHFHDDKNNLKCAVPCADWYKAWKGLREVNIYDPIDWSYVDIVNNTVLIVESFAELQEGLVIVNLEIEIHKANINDNFVSLENFTKF